MAYRTVTFTPTLDTSGYADGDVLFLMTPIQLPARGAKLIGGFMVDHTLDATNDGIQLHFFQNNAVELGTRNATANISGDNFLLNRYQGSVSVSNTTSVTELDNIEIHPILTAGDTTLAFTDNSLGAVLTSSETNYTVYVSGVVSTLSGQEAFEVDSLDFVLYFEY